jgi:pimeloyl-ACP methyl ester carboxylesterase
MTEDSSTQQRNSPISVLSDHGSGRAFITIIDDRSCEPLARAVANRLAGRARSVLLMSSPVNAQTWQELSDALAATLSFLQVRQVSLVGVGAGATLAQNLALSSPKSVRSLAIVDASSRPHPKWWERYVDWVEERLPFGLPLRLGSVGFNAKAYLHRLRCPLLAIATGDATSFVRDELRTLSARAPTAWGIELKGTPEQQVEDLTAALLAFQDTPAKCPQKNMREAV